MGQREAGILISNTCFPQGVAEGTERQMSSSQAHALLPGMRLRVQRGRCPCLRYTRFFQGGAEGAKRQLSSSQIHASPREGLTAQRGRCPHLRYTRFSQGGAEGGASPTISVPC